MVHKVVGMSLKFFSSEESTLKEDMETVMVVFSERTSQQNKHLSNYNTTILVL